MIDNKRKALIKADYLKKKPNGEAVYTWTELTEKHKASRATVALAVGNAVGKRTHARADQKRGKVAAAAKVVKKKAPKKSVKVARKKPAKKSKGKK